jgi:hypothetical protein
MEGLFALLVLASLILLVIGIFKPTTSLFWDKNSPTRKKSLLIYGGLTILFFVLFGVTTDKKNITEPTETKSEITKQIEKTKPEKIQETIKKESLFDNTSVLISKLSENGIGELEKWQNPFDMGWGSLSYKYPFGSKKDGVGMQNNIAYSIDGTETKAKKICIYMNINNPKEKKNALEFLNEIAEKTFKNLEIIMPTDLSNAILNSKIYKTEIGEYIISNELDKSKIETWKVNIERK